jgi:hypothetical protein
LPVSLLYKNNYCGQLLKPSTLSQTPMLSGDRVWVRSTDKTLILQ